MQKFTIDGIDVYVGNQAYTTRYCRLAVLLFLLLALSPSTKSNEPLAGYLLIGIVFSILLIELYRMVFKPTLLAISYDGIFHHKAGFIAWSEVESLDFEIGERNSMIKSLIVNTIATTVTYKYYLRFKPYKVESNIIRLEMSYTDCNIKEACYQSKIMHQWYLAHHQAS